MDNKTMMQYFEWYLPSDKSLWNRVREEASNLKDIGITSVWLPPAYKGARGINDVGYSVYDLYDLGEFNQKGTVETKYGSKDEYLSAIEELHNNNIEVLADVVLGHKTGADEKEKTFAYKDDMYDRNKEIEGLRKVEVWTKFNFEGRGNTYSDFKWNWTHFDGIDYDELNHESGIYRFIGKTWDEEVDKQFGNYDYLLGADVDMEDGEVIEELNKWGKWYLDFTNVDGFRLDAIKHIQFKFFKIWLRKLRRITKKELFSVGEYWSMDIESLENYIKKTSRSIALFDVPLHFNMHNASCSDGEYDMRNIFNRTLVDSNPKLAVTFVDNHDSQYGQALESWVQEWFKPLAYSLILLRSKGYPCVFFGDYYGVNSQSIKPVKDLDKLLELRKKYAYGIEKDYFDDKNIIGWTRAGDKEHPNSGMAVIMTNNLGGEKKMFMGLDNIGSRYYDYLNNINEEVIIDEEGYGIFKVLDKTVSVWIKN